MSSPFLDTQKGSGSSLYSRISNQLPSHHQKNPEREEKESRNVGNRQDMYSFFFFNDMDIQSNLHFELFASYSLIQTQTASLGPIKITDRS